MNNIQKPVALLVLACCLLAAIPVASAVDWQGQDSEFGTIRAPYAATMAGERVPIEARVVLRDLYEEQESRFFMFAFTVENTPLDIRFDSLVRTDTGKELPCYQRQGDARSAIKCFVDLRDMPSAGTEIRMYGTVGSSRTGLFYVGAMVVPFTYTWLRVEMSNDLNAELYAGTQLNVESSTGGGGFGGSGNGVLAKVPGIGALGIAVATVAAIGVLALRRRR